MNETKQSDGPYFAYECGCTMGYISIDYCPKHKAAPEMYEAAQNTVTYYAATAPGRTCLNDELNPCLGLRHWGGGVGCPLCSARAALARAEGKP